MTTIAIDKTSCTKCGNCVAVCPAVIFMQQSKESEIKTQREEICITCGHCVAVCPTDSISHSKFPDTKIHKVVRSEFPSPEQMRMLLMARRSHRAFTKEPVPESKLNQILEAAHSAPTSGNSQNVEYTLITTPERLQQLSNMTIDIFDKATRKADNPIIKPILKIMSGDLYRNISNLRILVEEYKNGNDRVLRGATSVILIHTPVGDRFGAVDANLAYQNASLMAESLGIAHFFGGFITVAIKQDKGKMLKEQFGVQREVHAVMLLGMPQFRYPKYMDKKDIVVQKL